MNSFALTTSPPVDEDTGFFNAAPKLTLAYHVSDAMLLYASTGLGFKPGGFSPLIDPPLSPKFETERVWASEIGMKSAWLDDKLTANVALFYYDITDYQVEQIVPPGFDNTVVNAPKARSLGAEVELTARPAAGWELSGFFGRVGATFLGDMYADAANTPAFKQSAYGLLNARAPGRPQTFGVTLTARF